jgi:hypothetical protein
MAIVLVWSSALPGAILEPDPYPGIRPRRTDYVREWYIFYDSKTDGILNPGDTRVSCMENWWTPVSASTQHNYNRRPGEASTDDHYSAPYSFRDPSTEAYWMNTDDGADNSISFYMTYSHWDNHDYTDMTTPEFVGMDATEQARLQQRNMYRNGWAMGWVNNDTHTSTGVAGSVKMDVYIHDGKLVDPSVDYIGGTTGTSQSNPQVSLSNDVQWTYNAPAGEELRPPDYNTVGGVEVGYDWNLNKPYYYANEVEFDDVVASMEVREVDPTDPTDLLKDHAIWSDRTPAKIAATLTDGHGNPYLYQDAVISRDGTNYDDGAPYPADEADGGVIAGLGGYNDYDPADPDQTLIKWGDQQVIRIDFDYETFTEGEINSVRFFDFGQNAPSTQTVPIVLEIFADAGGQLWWNGVALPENRIYIARVADIPEPGTLLLLAFGGLNVVYRRTVRRRRVK